MYIKLPRLDLTTVSNGNKTEWSPIRSAIIRVINKIGRPRSVVIYEAPFLIKTQEIPRFFLLAVTKKNHLSARVMARTVQLLRHEAYCPI